MKKKAQMSLFKIGKNPKKSGVKGRESSKYKKIQPVMWTMMRERIGQLDTCIHSPHPEMLLKKMENIIEHLVLNVLTVEGRVPSPKKNPTTQAMVNKGIEIRERFSGEEVGDITKKKISLPGPGEPLIVLAEIPEIRYLSNKEGAGDDQVYVHDLARGSDGKYPILCCTVDRLTMFIIGGKFKIKSHHNSDLFWLVD